MLEDLNPISGNHSVNRAVISLFLPQEILVPERLLEKLNSDSHFINKYKRRNLLKLKTFQIASDQNKVSLSNTFVRDADIGVILEEFDESGKIANILTTRNQDGKCIITFETRDYVRWNSFYESFKEDFLRLTKENEFYFEAVSLTYIDELQWLSEVNIPVNQIFKDNSELINSKFLKSKNGTIVLFSQLEDLNIEERTEISFNNELKRVQIIHQHITKFKKFFDVGHFVSANEAILNVAHTSNKDMLKNLLSETVQKKINLN